MKIKIFIKYVIFLFFFILSTISSASEWLTSSGNYDSLKYTDLKQINDSNANNIDLAWVFKNGFVPDKNSYFRNNNQATPIFTGKYLISSSLDDYVIAINPENGDEIWRTKIENPAAKRGLTFYDGNIYVPSGKGVFILREHDGSLNKNYGKNGLIEIKYNSKTLVPPIVLKNKIIIAYLTSIASHSLPSGDLNWEIDLNGSRVWSGISYDKINESLVFVTSNLINLLGDTAIEDDYSNSIVIVDGITGKLRCRFKDTIHDHWDLDMVGNPIIVDTKKSKVAYGFSKTGNIFVVDINQCKLINKSIKKIKTKNQSPINGQIYSDFQIKIDNPENFMNLKYDLKSYLNYISDDEENQNYIKHRTRNSKFNENYIPLSLDYYPIMFGLHGGPEWPGGAFDKKNNQIILPTNHYPWIIRSYYTCCLKNTPSAIRKAHQYLINLNHSDAFKIYKNKCSSCHRKNKNGRYIREFVGDGYVPSLNGITKTNKINSLIDLKSFNFSHKYTNNLEIEENELKVLKKYFEAHDKYLIEKDLLKLSATWQLLLDKNGDFASIPPYGKLTAFDLKSGKINWQIPFGEKIVKNKLIQGDINFGGVLSTAGNIFIATGTPDNNVYIFNSLNGKEIWRSKLNHAGSSPPMSFEYNGQQYIVINSSGGKYYGYDKEFGDAIYAFKLKNIR